MDLTPVLGLAVGGALGYGVLIAIVGVFLHRMSRG